jgi:hypothetical protein
MLYLPHHAACTSACPASCPISSTLTKLGITIDPKDVRDHTLLEKTLEEYTREGREKFWQDVFALQGDWEVGGFFDCIKPVRTSNILFLEKLSTVGTCKPGFADRICEGMSKIPSKAGGIERIAASLPLPGRFRKGLGSRSRDGSWRILLQSLAGCLSRKTRCHQMLPCHYGW